MTIMLDGVCLSEAGHKLQRAQGEGDVRFSRKDGKIRLSHLHQAGCCKVRLPKTYDAPPEAVFLNTAGGLTGGDTLSFNALVDENACATFTSQACERIYRSTGDDALITNRLGVASGASAEWLPQETILFNGGRLQRCFDVELASDARLLAVESVILGRMAMGEAVVEGAFRDRWRIRIDGHLIFADDTRLPFDMSLLDGIGALGGGRAFATIVKIGNGLEDEINTLRSITVNSTLGVSQPSENIMVTRIIAPTGETLRRDLMGALGILREKRPLPRVWHT